MNSISNNLDESLGVRQIDTRPRLSPVPNERDVGRRPLRNFASISIDQVVPDPEQPREEFSDEELEQLAKSILDKGQLSPIRVRWSEKLSKWVIVYGERRWRASKRAGLQSIECYFHDGDLTKSEILEQQLIENCLRQDLSAIEEARAFARLKELNGWTGKQLAEALRLAEAKVSRSLALLDLPVDIQGHVQSGKIPARSAYEISRVKGERARRELAKQAMGSSLTHEQLARAARQRQGKRSQRPRGTRVTLPIEGGWRVVVSANRKARYEEVEQALSLALEEIRHRINNNVQLF